MRSWLVPFTFLGVLLGALIWDLADGSEDVPPWVCE